MSTRMIEADGVALATQAFGDRTDPTVLLIMGAMASMLWWPEEFCTRLAARGRHVIRYDSRDTGLSSTWEPGKPGYTVDDLVADPVRILDAYGVEKAHVVGMSMGGAIAQRVALAHPARVASLTVISSSPVGEDTSSLPGASPAYSQHAARFDTLDWTDRDAVIALMLEDARMLTGTHHPFDAAQARAHITADVDRARNFASATNHFMLGGDGDWTHRLGWLQARLLVIHGTADPIFPIEHGRALAAAVPGATLLPLEGGGHELHPAHWDRIVDAIVNHSRC